MVKNGSKIKKILQNNATFDPSGIILSKNEFLFDRKCKYSERSKNRINSEFNGRYVFEEEDYFTEKHSKPYKDFWESKTANETENEIKTANGKKIKKSFKKRLKDSEPNSEKQFSSEVKASGPAEKDLSDEEIKKLAWGGGK